MRRQLSSNYQRQLDEYSGNAKYCFENSKKVVANIQNKSNLVKFDINKIQIQLTDLHQQLRRMPGTEETPISSPKKSFKRQPLWNEDYRMGASDGFNKRHDSLIDRDEDQDSSFRQTFQESGKRASSANKWGDARGSNAGQKDCLSQLKIVEMNCEELVRKMNNKDNDLDILNELLFENEQNTVDILDTTKSFIESMANPEKVIKQRPHDLSAQNESLK